MNNLILDESDTYKVDHMSEKVNWSTSNHTKVEPMFQNASVTIHYCILSEPVQKADSSLIRE